MPFRPPPLNFYMNLLTFSKTRLFRWKKVVIIRNYSIHSWDLLRAAFASIFDSVGVNQNIAHYGGQTLDLIPTDLDLI